MRFGYAVPVKVDDMLQNSGQSRVGEERSAEEKKAADVVGFGFG